MLLMATFQLQLNLGKLNLAFNQSYTTIRENRVFEHFAAHMKSLGNGICVQSTKHAVFSKSHNVYALQFLYQYQL